MTSTTTTAKAASNGKASSAAERKAGMAYVQEAVAYHLASVAHDAAFEAERLCNDIYRAVSGAYLRDGRKVSEAAEAAMSDDTLLKADDASRCLNAALAYLRQLAGLSTDQSYWSAPF